MERLRKKILLKLSVRVEVSSVESNETTAATVSCDLAPPPQRRRRRHPPPLPPRNLPFVTFQGSKEAYLSLHNRLSVCPVRPPHAAAAGLLLRARRTRAGDIDRLLQRAKLFLNANVSVNIKLIDLYSA